MHDMKFVMSSPALSALPHKGQVLHLLKDTMAAPKVVIVGGGIGGVSAAQQLEGFADVTLIDRYGHWLCSGMHTA